MKNKDQILLENLYNEIYYDTRKPPKNEPSRFGYFDADKLLGKRVWVHTNLTNRRNGSNGMFGVYIPTTKDGKETLSDERYGYTNEIRLTNISFDVDIPCVQGIIDRNKRTICSGIIGTIIKTEGDTSGFEEFTFNPFTKVFGYYRKNDPKMEILTGADEVYLNSLEDGKYIILGKGLKIDKKANLN